MAGYIFEHSEERIGVLATSRRTAHMWTQRSSALEPHTDPSTRSFRLSDLRTGRSPGHMRGCDPSFGYDVVPNRASPRTAIRKRQASPFCPASSTSCPWTRHQAGMSCIVPGSVAVTSSSSPGAKPRTRSCVRITGSGHNSPLVSNRCCVTRPRASWLAVPSAGAAPLPASPWRRPAAAPPTSPSVRCGLASTVLRCGPPSALPPPPACRPTA